MNSALMFQICTLLYSVHDYKATTTLKMLIFEKFISDFD